MDKKLNILLVEDSASDAKMLEIQLSKNYDTVISRIENETDYINELKTNPPQIILSDYNLPSFNGMEALKIRKEIAPFIPFILVTGTLNEETAVEVMKNGADDYILKDNLKRLPHAAKSAIEKMENLRMKNQTEEKLKEVLEYSINLFYSYNPDKKLTYVSPQSKKFLGCSPDEALINWAEFLTDNPVNQKGIEIAQRGIDTGTPQPPYELELRKKTGEIIWVKVNESPVVKNGKTEAIVGSLTDITEKRQVQIALQESENSYRNLVENISDIVYSVDEEGKLVFLNSSIEKILGFKPEEIIGKPFADFIHPEHLEKAMKNFNEIPHDRIKYNEYKIKCKDGKSRLMNVSSSAIFYDNKFAGVTGVLVDITDMKAAEEKLKFNSHLLNEIGEAVVATDVNGNIIYWNRAAEKLYGWKYNEVIGKNIIEVTPSDWTKEEAQKIFEKLRIGESWFGELSVRRKDGTSFPASVTDSPIFNSNGDLIGIVGISTDITERKEAEKKLEEAYNQLNLIYTNLPEAIFSVDPVNKKMLRVSPGHYKVFGYLSSEFVKNPNLWFDVVIPEDKSIIEAANERLAQGKIASFEYRVKRPGGEINWIETRMKPTLDSSGKLIRIDGISSNITERHKYEEALLASEEKYRNLVENIDDIVYSVDQNGIITFLNSSAERITGFRSSEIIGKPFAEFIHPDDRMIIMNNFVRLTEEKNINAECRIITKTGEFRDVQITSTGTFTNSYFTGAIGILVDITEKKNMIAELIASKEKAEEANRLKSNFLANMSHELRTPLTGILGFSELLAEEITNDEHLQMAGNITTSGQRLLVTLNSILDLSRIESNKYEVSFDRVSLNTILKEEYNLFYYAAANKNISLKLNLPVTEIEINSDGRMLKSIVSNLIHNAVKFTKKGGVIVSLMTENDYAILSVKDSGIGISNNDHEVIFEEFRQVSEGLSRSFEGSGLGLTIVKKFVKLLNGEVLVKSLENAGSEFIIRLPFSNETPLKKKSHSNSHNKLNKSFKPDEENNSAKKILIVEDDPHNLSYIERILKKKYSVAAVQDGVSAYRLASRTKFDLIIMDINLGNGIDGLDTIKIIRKREYYKNIPIIALTAFAMVGDREKFLESGFDDYLSKPFEKKNLLIKITQFLGEKFVKEAEKELR